LEALLRDKMIFIEDQRIEDEPSPEIEIEIIGHEFDERIAKLFFRHSLDFQKLPSAPRGSILLSIYTRRLGWFLT
jgi:hypothetical protein